MLAELLKIIIIDIGFTVHLFSNELFANNKCKSKKHLNLKTNRGPLKVNDIRDAEFDTV